MNERIKELYEPLWEHINVKLEAGEGHHDYGWGWTKEYREQLFKDNMEKFAELIVKECMEVAIHKDDGMISDAGIAGYIAAGRATAAKMIAKHFGV